MEFTESGQRPLRVRQKSISKVYAHMLAEGREHKFYLINVSTSEFKISDLSLNKKTFKCISIH